MPERWEIVQSVTEEENLGARVYPKSIEVYPRRMKIVRGEESWTSLGPREGRGREMGDCERGDQGRESAGA